MPNRLPSETNYDAFEAGYAASGYTLPKWINVVRAAPGIPAAMGYAALPSDVRNAIWDKFDETESTGYVPDLADLADMQDWDAAWSDYPVLPPGIYPDDVRYTRQELMDSLASKYAHAFFLEINKTFPWRLTRYSQEELRCLFDPVYLYWRGDRGGAGGNQWETTASGTPLGVDWNGPYYAVDYSVADHSPFRSWAVAGTDLGGILEGFAPATNSQAEYVREFFRECGNFHYLHGAVQDYTSATHIDTLHDTAKNGRPPTDALISRRGCHSFARWFCAWMRAINVPARLLFEVWKNAHASFLVYLDGRAYHTGHADSFYLGNSKYETVGETGNDSDPWHTISPLGALAPYAPLADAGWLEDLEDAVATTGPESAERGSACLKADCRRFFGPRSDLSESQVGYIGQNWIDYYLTYGWDYLNTTSPDFVGSGFDGQYVRARLIRITGQDNP